jgi:glycosyltransferase involved in cell wall biosynthesis
MALRIVHILRAPVGGLFRHVRDLAAAQAAAGHEVGVICDSTATDTLTTARLDALKPHLSLGLHQTPMSRSIGPGDVTSYLAIGSALQRLNAGIVHGHGAKGGAYARLAAGTLKRQGRRIFAVYTPHGGSLHYDPRSISGRLYLGLERQLAGMTDGLIFESAFSAAKFRSAVGRDVAHTAVIPNGLMDEDFAPQEPTTDASDILFVGELRQLKGVDVLLEALHRVGAVRPVTATIVGDGPDRETFVAQANQLGLTTSVSWTGAMPARSAFARGRIMVVPSRAESFPYIVLEAAAAAMPMIATNVGGIPEIVAGSAVKLVMPGDAAALAERILATLADPDGARAAALGLRELVAARFTVQAMASAIETLYGVAAARAAA